MAVFVHRENIYNKKLQLEVIDLQFREPISELYKKFSEDASPDFRRIKPVDRQNFQDHLDFKVLNNGLRACIPFSAEELLDGVPLIFKSSEISIELKEDQKVTDELLAALKKYRVDGFEIVLNMNYLNYYALGDFIKINFLKAPEPALRAYNRRIKTGENQLIAINLNTFASFDLAMKLGYGFGHGNFVRNVEVSEGNEVDPEKIERLKTIYNLNDGKIEFNQVEELLKSDRKLSKSLFRIINSVSYGFSRKIENPKQAATLLGLNQLKSIISLAGYKEIADTKRKTTDFFFRRSLERAKFCEFIAEAQEVAMNDSFIIGLMSLIDRFLDIKMEVILPQLQLPEKLENGIRGDGELGKQVHLTSAYENGRWDEVDGFIEEMGLQEADVPKMYNEALKWAEDNYQA